MRAGKTRLPLLPAHFFSGLPEPSLLNNAISTKKAMCWHICNLEAELAYIINEWARAVMTKLPYDIICIPIFVS